MARIAGVNIPQNKIVQTGLTYIYGIGDKFSKQICSALEIPNSKRVNELRPPAGTRPSGSSENVLFPTHPRQMLPSSAL